MLVTLTDLGITLSIDQITAVKRISEEHDGHIHWHMNDCGCCLTIHAPDCAYVINRDGDETFYANRGCQCPPD